jgi:hypothetical protein
VAGGISQRKKDRFPFTAGFLQSFGTPGKPVHGVAAMLEQVGAGLKNQPIELLASV